MTGQTSSNPNSQEAGTPTPPPLYELTVDLQVLKHLGIGLYSNLPSVMSEMVANAFDADAAEVVITIEDDKITIKDDGLGMTQTEANDKFLKVGFPKRGEKSDPNEQFVTDKFRRLPMGRKGIGKLSTFAIANVVQVESVRTDPKTGEIKGKAAFLMRVSQIEEEAKKKLPYYPEPLSVEDIDFEIGTRITLTSLKRKRRIDPRFVITNLARRFSGLGDSFVIKVGNHNVTSSDRQYWDKLQFVWGLGDNEPFRDAKKGIKISNDRAIAACKDVDGILNTDILSDTVNIADISTRKVSGWIGSVYLPKDLKDENDNIDNNGIVVMARRKLVHENMLPFARNTRVFSEYIVGEINADWLDVDQEEDMATSGRQSLNETDERFAALRLYVRDRLREIAAMWDEWRRAVGATTAIARNPVLQEWIDGLNSDNKIRATKLIATIEGMPVSDEDSKRELFKHGIMAFETLALKGNLDALEKYRSISAVEFRTILRAMSDLDAAHYYQVAKNRWSVLGKFENLIDDDAKERVIQEEIYGHPWLLHSSWERPTEDARMEKRFVSKLKAERLGLDKNERLSRYDIKYLAVSGIDLVVELKRSGRTLKFGDLITQVEKYNKILKALQKADQTDRDFEIVVVLGTLPDGWGEEQKKSFEALKARVFTYENLVKDARSSYKDFIESRRAVSKIEEIVNAL